MRLPVVPPAPLDHCPRCAMPLSNHPADCECSELACRAKAVADVRRGQERRRRLRCERHTRLDVVLAERYGTALLIQGIVAQPALL